jgi:hypothetical protein
MWTRGHSPELFTHEAYWVLAALQLVLGDFFILSAMFD